MMMRSFLLVLASPLLICANHSSTAQNDPVFPGRRGDEAAATVKQFSKYSADPCYQVNDPEVAASCAQWKAADAAKSSADASWWTVYFAGLGVALAAITMAAAIAAAYFAKKAAYENKRSADAAHDANRPWLDVDLVLHGVHVNYDRKGYSLRLEVKPLNSGVSPARDVREHAECLFYEQIPGHRDPISMSTTARDVALQSCAEAVTAKLREERDAGPTVFPSRDQPFYIETFVPWDFTDGYPCGVAWLIVGLRYFFPEGCGETVKVFSIRSFGFSGEDDFASMGDSPFATIDSNPTVKSWPRHGYIR